LMPSTATAQFAEKGVDSRDCAKGRLSRGSGGRAQLPCRIVAVGVDGGWPFLIERMDHPAYLAGCREDFQSWLMAR
jgi:hypothetical protein